MPDPPDKSAAIPVRVAQVVLAEIAGDLMAVEDRLRAVRDGLPRSPHQEEMLEGDRPIDLATVLLGIVECALADQIRPAIEALEHAARLEDPR